MLCPSGDPAVGQTLPRKCTLKLKPGCEGLRGDQAWRLPPHGWVNALMVYLCGESIVRPNLPVLTVGHPMLLSVTGMTSDAKQAAPAWGTMNHFPLQTAKPRE